MKIGKERKKKYFVRHKFNVFSSLKGISVDCTSWEKSQSICSIISLSPNLLWNVFIFFSQNFQIYFLFSSLINCLLCWTQERKKLFKLFIFSGTRQRCVGDLVEKVNHINAPIIPSLFFFSCLFLYFLVLFLFSATECKKKLIFFFSFRKKN